MRCDGQRQLWISAVEEDSGRRVGAGIGAGAPEIGETPQNKPLIHSAEFRFNAL
jgi:hypothetical protein